jgi:hypothetical protein
MIALRFLLVPNTGIVAGRNGCFGLLFNIEHNLADWLDAGAFSLPRTKRFSCFA